MIRSMMRWYDEMIRSMMRWYDEVYNEGRYCVYNSNRGIPIVSNLPKVFSFLQ